MTKKKIFKNNRTVCKIIFTFEKYKHHSCSRCASAHEQYYVLFLSRKLFFFT